MSNVMPDNQELSSPSERGIEIVDALPIKLQVLDFARHAVAAPNGKRYVVATFDDTRLGRGYVTAIYPQQNGYLTLYRLTLYEHSSDTPEEAIQHHLTVAQAIQQGRLSAFAKKTSLS